MADAKRRSVSGAWTFAKDILLVAVVLAVTTGLALAVPFISRPTPQAAFDFSLAVLPPVTSVAAGSSSTTTVMANATTASSQDFQFACADLPTGATCSFTPPSCRPTCSAGLVLATSASTPTGTHLVTIAAFDGTISRRTTFRVTVTAPTPFDFSLTIDPGSGSTASGGNASTNITATLVSGATHAIQFTCSDLPPGATCTFLPPSCSPTCTAALTVATSANTPAGTHVINVTASDGSVPRTAPYSLAVWRVSTVTFQKGDGGAYSETDDATLNNQTPTVNYGADPLFRSDGQSCIANLDVCRGLLSFPNFTGPNEGQVPANSTIVSATLEVNVTNHGPSQRLLQVTESWTEASVTWNSFATPGMPRTKGAAIQFNTTLGKFVLNITDIAQNWVNGDPNLGLLFRHNVANGSYYSSSESVNPPRLVVTFRSGSVAVPPAMDSRLGSSGPIRSGDSQSSPLELTSPDGGPRLEPTAANPWATVRRSRPPSSTR